MLVSALGQPEAFPFLVYLGSVVSRGVNRPAALCARRSEKGERRLWRAVDLLVFSKRANAGAQHVDSVYSSSETSEVAD